MSATTSITVIGFTRLLTISSYSTVELIDLGMLKKNLQFLFFDIIGSYHILVLEFGGGGKCLSEHVEFPIASNKID